MIEDTNIPAKHTIAIKLIKELVDLDVFDTTILTLDTINYRLDDMVVYIDIEI